MQDTRLNRLFDTTIDRLTGWLTNPWRRLSILVINLLLGNFLGTALITTAGQRAELDILVAALLVLGIELLNRVLYQGRSSQGQPLNRRSLLLESANALKLGLTYSLFVEAFKLGS